MVFGSRLFPHDSTTEPAPTPARRRHSGYVASATGCAEANTAPPFKNQDHPHHTPPAAVGNKNFYFCRLFGGRPSRLRAGRAGGGLKLLVDLPLQPLEFLGLQVQTLAVHIGLGGPVSDFPDPLVAQAFEFLAEPLAGHGCGRAQAILIGRRGIGCLPDDLLKRPNRRVLAKKRGSLGEGVVSQHLLEGGHPFPPQGRLVLDRRQLTTNPSEVVLQKANAPSGGGEVDGLGRHQPAALRRRAGRHRSVGPGRKPTSRENQGQSQDQQGRPSPDGMAPEPFHATILLEFRQ